MAKTIKFIEQVNFVRAGKADQLFVAGQEYTLRDDQARRWTTRGVAVEVKDGVAMPPPVKIIPPEQRPTPFPPVNFQASQGSTEFAKGGADGDAVAGSADVSGKGGGGAGERPEHVSGGGRGSSRGGRAGAGNK